jgi:hypothetical protein
MQLYDWNRIEKEQMNPSFARQVIHGETMTVARVYLKKGCLVPEHSHHNEQISMLEQGALRFVIGGVEKVVKAGEVLRILRICRTAPRRWKIRWLSICFLPYGRIGSAGTTLTCASE